MDRRASLIAVSSSALFLGQLHAQGGAVKRIGYMTNGRRGLAFEAFKDSLAALGYHEGRNIAIEARFAAGQAERLPALASELVSLGVDVIAASGAVAVLASQRATSSIPIVFAAVLSPAALVEIGLAASPDRPGGNITGFSSSDPQQPAKSFHLLKEIVPELRSIALVSDQDIPRPPSDPGWSHLERAYESAARDAELRPTVFRVKGPTPDLVGMFSTLSNEKVQAVLVLEVPVPLQQGYNARGGSQGATSLSETPSPGGAAGAPRQFTPA